MKKVVPFVLALLLTGILVGCGMQEGSSETVKTQNLSEPTEGTVLTEAPADAEAETCQDTVLFENSSYKITFVGVEDSWIGKDITVSAENFTQSDIVLTNEHIAVNGVSVVAQLHLAVAAGDQSQGAMSINGSDLERAGIGTVDVLRLLDFYIRNADGFDIAEEVEGEVVLSSNGTAELPEEAGEVLFESNGVTFVSQEMADGYLGEEVRIFARNESDRKLIVAALDPIINGNPVSDAFAYDRFVLHPDTAVYGTFILSEEALKEAAVTEVEAVSFTLALLDGEAEFMVAQKYGIEFQPSDTDS